MATTRGARTRKRGFVRQRGGSYEAVVYAGIDPLTGKKVYLSESYTDPQDAEKARVRLVAKVDAQRSTATRETLAYALDAWLEVHEGEVTTIDGYRGYIERTIKPALGEEPISKLSARALEQFYAQLRRCRVRCDGKRKIDHRAEGTHDCRVVHHARVRAHDCDKSKCRVVECKPHVCTPLSPATVNQIHAIIRATLSAAVRWDWIPSNPASVAKKPRLNPPQPKPPTAQQAAQIVNAAWAEDVAWGTLIWLAMMTGARRGELLALRWNDVHWTTATLEIRRSYTARAGRAIEKDTKTHQMRRLALDEATMGVLRAHRARYEGGMRELRVDARENAFVFSYEPDWSRPCHPDGVSHRYGKMCADLGIETHLHALRHYSATELISSGVDVRTVAGRLGHGGGGVTTLRVYAAWVGESDRRAAELLAGRFRIPPQDQN
jgi:integrase